ncbi:hypothetical protein CAPI_01685 [Corynebacterium capitovis DSM 44611]|uniref:hypothetical protein n=1 Tax=Corynebacterium capitovis TaxID=131081 RepID=UPI0003A20B27|nr:hypothetical protein [Corynebacterium capitovis]WKD56911.1 hypothetical protein CAPI_01685 [Corynebacterium capitovis DSM 44611]
MNVPLNVDPAGLRAQLGDAVEQRRALIEELVARQPDFPATAVGPGFVGHVTALREAMAQLHQTTIAHMEHRVGAWVEIMELAHAVEETDGSNAAAFGQRGNQ